MSLRAADSVLFALSAFVIGRPVRPRRTQTKADAGAFAAVAWGFRAGGLISICRSRRRHPNRVGNLAVKVPNSSIHRSQQRDWYGQQPLPGGETPGRPMRRQDPRRQGTEDNSSRSEFIPLSRHQGKARVEVERSRASGVRRSGAVRRVRGCSTTKRTGTSSRAKNSRTSGIGTSGGRLDDSRPGPLLSARRGRTQTA